MRVVLATGNAGKVREFNAILEKLGWNLIAQTAFDITQVEETGATFADNALLKARHAAARSGLAALADDSGLEVDALAGEPGVYSARYAGPHATDEDNNAKLLAALATAAAPRTARYRCALAFVREATDSAPVLVEACWEGSIALTARGEGGFGYDPLFLPADGPAGLTAAELDAAHKNRLSHRAKALAALIGALATQEPAP